MEKNGQIRREIKNGIKMKGKDMGEKGQQCMCARLLLDRKMREGMRFSLCVRKFENEFGAK